MAEEAAQDKGAEEEGGGKKKFPLWVVILIASQLVIVVAALVVFKMMSKQDQAPVEATDAEQRIDPSKVTDAKTLVGPEFALSPFLVNLLDDGRGPRFLKIEVKFELEDEKVRVEIETRLSQMRDELLTLLSSKRLSDIETSDGKRILRDEIFTRVNKVLVTGRIKRVFFTEFVVQ